MSDLPIEIEPFTPYRWFVKGHAQTIASNVLRRPRGIQYRRERLFTPDGDFVDIDFVDVANQTWRHLGPDAPIILVLHGLEGTSKRGYMQETYRQVAARGMRPVGMNLRGCSGEMNWRPRFYHAGDTSDVHFVLAQLEARFPGIPKGLVGFSLGGNIILKYLGEDPDRILPTIVGAVAVSPPFNLVTSTNAFMHGSGRMYSGRFLRDLKEKLHAKAHLLEGKIDLDAALAAESIRELDEYATAPLNGFRDALDYYEKNGCEQFLSAINIPTLILRSLDDPFFDRSLPTDVIDANPALTAVFTKHGGHVGFLEDPRQQRFWSERQAARYLAALTKDSHVDKD